MSPAAKNVSPRRLNQPIHRPAFVSNPGQPSERRVLPHGDDHAVYREVRGGASGRLHRRRIDGAGEPRCSAVIRPVAERRGIGA
jgi:hypothetical protein